MLLNAVHTPARDAQCNKLLTPCMDVEMQPLAPAYLQWRLYYLCMPQSHCIESSYCQPNGAQSHADVLAERFP